MCLSISPFWFSNPPYILSPKYSSIFFLIFWFINFYSIFVFATPLKLCDVIYEWPPFENMAGVRERRRETWVIVTSRDIWLRPSLNTQSCINPNWHEAGPIYPPYNFLIRFCLLNFHWKVPNIFEVKIEINRDNLRPCQAHGVI